MIDPATLKSLDSAMRYRLIEAFKAIHESEICLTQLALEKEKLHLRILKSSKTAPVTDADLEQYQFVTRSLMALHDLGKDK